MRIRSRYLAPMLVAAAAAAAIAAAPSAAATSNPTTCHNKGAANHCARAGHSSIVATPPVRAQQPFGFNLGFGPMNPQLLALD
ncbi:MAG: hypothetical protein KDB55_16185 [Mycobacterium sp.]|nr:hypothetical protein [Mycobacterium sp.]